jgi:hypothetical protein
MCARSLTQDADGLPSPAVATIREQAAEVLQTARIQRWPPEDVLRTLIAAESAGRDQANRQIRLKQASFPATKTLDNFGRGFVHPTHHVRLPGLAGVDPSHREFAAGGPGGSRQKPR